MEKTKTDAPKNSPLEGVLHDDWKFFCDYFRSLEQRVKFNDNNHLCILIQKIIYFNDI